MTEETKQRIVILKALPNAAQLVIPESLEVLSVVSGDGSHVSGKGKPVGDATQTAGKPVKKGLWQRVKEFLREHLSSNYKTLNTNYVTEYQNSNFGKGHSNLDNLQSQIDELMVGKTPAESALVLKKGRSLATLQRTTVIHSVMDAVLKDRLSAKFTPIDQKTLFTQIMASPEIQDLLKQQGEFREALWPNRAKEIEYLMEPHYYSQESLEAFNKKLKNYAQIKVTLGLDDADVKVRVKEMLSQYAKMVSSSFVKATQAMPNPVVPVAPDAAEDDEYEYAHN